MVERTKLASRVILKTIGVPLLLLSLGIWEQQRIAADRANLDRQRDALVQAVARLDAEFPGDRGLDMRFTFRRDGQTYGGPLAARKVHEALEDADTGLVIAQVRRVLPSVVATTAGLAALLACLMLGGASLAARIGLRSRDRLADGFSILRRFMPVALGGSVLLLATSVVAATVFEVLALPEAGNYSEGTLKMFSVAALIAGVSIVTAFRASRQLRRVIASFTPESMDVTGYVVTERDAPGLWRTLADISARLDALPPENVVVGLEGGFWVSSGSKLLQPGDAPLGGRTLYLPLPLLALLQPDEVSAVIGHELAHFTGADTEYSLRFLPIYVGVSHSLNALVGGGVRRPGTSALLTRPALGLGFFAMERFHHTVRHWSRVREFAADAAGASVASGDAAARALLRITAAERVIHETLIAAFRAPDTASTDLVAAILMRANSGLDDPTPHLEQNQPHPTDTHPPTRQRLQALGLVPGAVSAMKAAAPPASDAQDGLVAYFADPKTLCRQASSDFLERGRAGIRAGREALRTAVAAGPTEERVLYENVKSMGLGLLGLGFVVAFAGVSLSWLGLDGLGPVGGWIGETATPTGAVIMLLGVVRLCVKPRPIMVLGPATVSLTGLDRPLAWSEVADMDMMVDRGRISTRMLLPPDVPFPTRAPGAGVWPMRRVRLDPRQRVVTLTSGLPAGMKARDLAALIDRYRTADRARHRLTGDQPPSSTNG